MYDSGDENNQFEHNKTAEEQNETNKILIRNIQRRMKPSSTLYVSQ